jgi:hypothetical protein
MTRLILTTDDSGAGCLKQTGIADIVIPFGLRFVCGPLPSEAQLADFLAERSAKHVPTGSHWLDNLNPARLGEAGRDIGFVDFCDRYEKIELWIDPEPKDQLILIWLLDYLRPHQKVVSKLSLVQANARIGNHTPEEVTAWRLPTVQIRRDHLVAASAAWQAYRATTPQACFNLLDSDLNILPQLGSAVLALLEELPMRKIGLGATEMRMLELMSAGHIHPYDVFPGHQKPNERRVFGYWEVGDLLDGFAHCPAPAVTGLDERPFDLDMHNDRDRHERYTRSRLALTELGKAVLAQADDFSRHNPIHRWWGGTELTNDRLWRWDPARRALDRDWTESR